MKKTIVLTLVFTSLFLFQCKDPNNQDQDYASYSKLSTLCKVWGYLKYYHPEIGKESVNWDSALVCYLEELESINNSDSIRLFFDNIVPQFNANFDSISDCNGDSLLLINHSLFWINDTNRFLKSTIIKFNQILDFKYTFTTNKIASNPWVNNPEFHNDTSYNNIVFPNKNLRLLSLFRYWNMINYYYPYKYLTDNNWDSVLDKFIPIFINATDTIDFHLSICKLTSMINDNHGYTTSDVLSRFWGNRFLAVKFNLVEEKTIISELYSDSIAKMNNLHVGDIILEIEGDKIFDIRDSLSQYFSGSSSQSTQHIISYYLSRTFKKDLNLTIKRSDSIFSLVVNTFPKSVISKIRSSNKKPKAIKEINNDITYIDLSKIDYNEVDSIIKKALDTKFMILDLRKNCKFIIHELCSILFAKQFSFYNVTKPNYSTPGTYCYSQGDKTGPNSNNPNNYSGTIILLVDIGTQSIGEFTAMALSMHKNSIIIGNPTAGTDGNISLIELPGKVKTYISGIGIYWIDGRQTQRIGVLPDITIYPQINSIKRGYDDIFEAAIKYAKSIKQ